MAHRAEPTVGDAKSARSDGVGWSSWVMAVEVRPTGDPELVLKDAGPFLASDPVRHNLILTLLYGRIEHPEPGRYWTVKVDGRAAGVVLQSPLHFAATVTPMADDAVTAVVDVIVDQGVELPGVNGEAATAARFAGHWTERTRSAAQPVQGQRIYEVEDVIPAAPVSGQLVHATAEQRDLLVAWFVGFAAETGEMPRDAEQLAERRLSAGHLWMWSDEAPVAMAARSGAVSRVARIGPVFTPSGHRNRGYASALVAALSNAVRSEGDRCILYTDLANPTSNSIYRAIGYRAVLEAVRYRFK